MTSIAKDFAGMKAVVQKGTTHEERMRKIKKDFFPSLVIETTTGFDGANKRVMADSKYFTYIDISTYFGVLEKKVPLKRQAAGDQKGESFGFIMPKSSDWDGIFNEFLSANGGYTKSIQYRKILSDNLGKQVLNLIDSMNR
jgi:putative glutamine transport system substrate-binding protein